jgi:acyl-CoA synthetase (AMP-forming)/AMP-acid ligase II
LHADPSAIAATGADDVAAIVFTSGSTGPPKGVVYRHRNFMAQVNAIRDAYGMKPGEVNLPTFPLFALFDPALGMTTVVPDMDPTRPARVDPRKIIDPIREHGVSVMFGSPALLDTVGRWGVANGVKLESLRCVISAGAPVPPRVIERFQSMLRDEAAIHTPYGATESLPVATTSSHEILSDTRHGTDRGDGTCVGIPVPSIEAAVITIDDQPIEVWSDDLEVGSGEVGEIVVKGPQVTTEYFNAARHTDLAKIKDGESVRHRMGDLGYFDDRGRLWFCGRKSQRVETASGTLFTVPCESVFNTHPEVFRTALVGVGETGVHKPVLCVELEQGVDRREHDRIRSELLEIGSRFDHTSSIRDVLFHPSFPVDIRHNAKIGRGALAVWAAPKVAS